jgi:hypothetical protein
VSLFSWFRRSTSGNVALIFALGAPALFAFIGIAVDYSSWVRQGAALQKAADAAALAVARELNTTILNENRIQAIAESVVAATFNISSGDGTVIVKANLINGRRNEERETQGEPVKGAKVTLSQRKAAIMSRIVTPELTDLDVSATAMVAGNVRVCVIGLDETAPDTIRLDDSAKISAGDCSVHVNSRDPAAIRSEHDARVLSLRTCTAGGFKGGISNFRPATPVTDCPKTPDPLAERPAPPVGACKYTNLVIPSGLRTLEPGTYCGGLKLQPGAIVWLNPGVYVIKDGQLHVGPPLLSVGVGGLVTVSVLPAVLKGNNVGFYFTGNVPADDDGRVTVMRFMKESIVEMTAPKDGAMAGLLFNEDRNAPANRRYEVVSDSARRLVGTIYFPRGIFSVSANQSIADKSEYTAVVTRRLELFQAPNLVLNARYNATDVPVPDGLGPNSGVIRLVE